jgi:SAM-dependent methyltransferase
LAIAMQRRFPGLWNLFQLTIGGTAHKRLLAARMFPPGARSVLEVGCSTGNLAPAWYGRGLRYTGLDIDAAAIRQAERSHGCRAGVRFVCASLEDFAGAGERFDAVAFCNVFHHVGDATVRRMLDTAPRLTASGGCVAVMDPLAPMDQDPLAIRLYLRLLEQGQHLRSERQQHDLLVGSPLLALHDEAVHTLTATPLFWPGVARLHLARLAPAA